ncbi:hypothetical protein WN944_019739 [Citrus x changshan-huyou]|uniref:Protein COFACTOR ASSEMBLY OF COMPLEX C SUBUNIT B CCB3 n=2 Tax=Citrus TaxID=2706 RepID=A0ACB8LDW2_CITSI|nr:protein COFACTOR ASSEMBLY OF COMPLEX C SUBUNIT B CCB3 [Citrus sinensis]
MATSFQLANTFHVKGWSPPMPIKQSFGISERLRSSSRRNPRKGHQVSIFSTCCFLEEADLLDIKLAPSTAAFSGISHDSVNIVKNIKLYVADTSDITSNFVHMLPFADLDPATAKLAIGIIGPFLSAFSFLFILRIVMSWYPKIPLAKFPYVLVYAPTEPFLLQTRKLIPPLAGVDITPVVWVGLLNFLNEILVGPQGLLVLVSQQIN